MKDYKFISSSSFDIKADNFFVIQPFFFIETEKTPEKTPKKTQEKTPAKTPEKTQEKTPQKMLQILNFELKKLHEEDVLKTEQVKNKMILYKKDIIKVIEVKGNEIKECITIKNSTIKKIGFMKDYLVILTESRLVIKEIDTTNNANVGQAETLTSSKVIDFDNLNETDTYNNIDNSLVCEIKDSRITDFYCAKHFIVLKMNDSYYKFERFTKKDSFYELFFDSKCELKTKDSAINYQALIKVQESGISYFRVVNESILYIINDKINIIDEKNDLHILNNEFYNDCARDGFNYLCAFMQEDGAKGCFMQEDGAKGCFMQKECKTLEDTCKEEENKGLIILGSNKSEFLIFIHNNRKIELDEKYSLELSFDQNYDPLFIKEIRTCNNYVYLSNKDNIKSYANRKESEIAIVQELNINETDECKESVSGSDTEGMSVSEVLPLYNIEDSAKDINNSNENTDTAIEKFTIADIYAVKNDENVSNSISTTHEMIGKTWNNTNEMISNTMNTTNEMIGKTMNTTDEMKSKTLNTTKEIPSNTMNTTDEMISNTVNTTDEMISKTINTTNEMIGKDLNTTHEMISKTVNTTDEIPSKTKVTSLYPKSNSTKESSAHNPNISSNTNSTCLNRDSTNKESMHNEVNEVIEKYSKTEPTNKSTFNLSNLLLKIDDKHNKKVTQISGYEKLKIEIENETNNFINEINNFKVFECENLTFFKNSNLSSEIYKILLKIYENIENLKNKKLEFEIENKINKIETFLNEIKTNTFFENLKYFDFFIKNFGKKDFFLYTKFNSEIVKGIENLKIESNNKNLYDEFEESLKKLNISNFYKQENKTSSLESRNNSYTSVKESSSNNTINKNTANMSHAAASVANFSIANVSAVNVSAVNGSANSQIHSSSEYALKTNVSIPILDTQPNNHLTNTFTNLNNHGPADPTTSLQNNPFTTVPGNPFTMQSGTVYNPFSNPITNNANNVANDNTKKTGGSALSKFANNLNKFTKM